MRQVNETKTIKNVKFANTSKVESIKEYIKECSDDNYETRDVISTRAIHFASKAKYRDFTENLLEDRDCLENLGSFDDAALIYFNNKPQFVVVTEGYSYARYLGLLN